MMRLIISRENVEFRKIMQNEQTVASGQNRVKLGNLSLHFLNHPYVLTTYVAVTTKKKPSEQS